MMWHLLFLAAAAWGALCVAAVAWGCCWQSVKPAAATAPPVADSAVPTAPEEGNHS